MRLRCFNCKTNCSSEIPNTAVVRGIITCPECAAKAASAQESETSLQAAHDAGTVRQDLNRNEDRVEDHVMFLAKLINEKAVRRYEKHYSLETFETGIVINTAVGSFKLVAVPVRKDGE